MSSHGKIDNIQEHLGNTSREMDTFGEKNQSKWWISKTL